MSSGLLVYVRLVTGIRYSHYGAFLAIYLYKSFYKLNISRLSGTFKINIPTIYLEIFTALGIIVFLIKVYFVAKLLPKLSFVSLCVSVRVKVSHPFFLFVTFFQHIEFSIAILPAILLPDMCLITIIKIPESLPLFTLIVNISFCLYNFCVLCVNFFGA
jgi:hypothetical protein